MSFLPNLVTILRLLGLPWFLWLVVEARNTVAAGGSIEGDHTALIVLTAIAVGDALDGWLARSFGWSSRLGAVLDPLVDKLTQASAYLFFTFFAEPAYPVVPIALWIALVLRDLVLATGSLVLHRRGQLDVQARWTGKLATLLSFTLLIVVTARLESLVPAFCWITFAAVLVSGVHYVTVGVTAARSAGANGS